MKIFKNSPKEFFELTKKRLLNVQLFDLLSLFVFLGIAVILFLFLLRKKEYINVTIRVQSDRTESLTGFYPPSWFSFLFREGMQEKDGLGRIKAEVKNVQIYDVWPDTKIAFLEIRLQTIYNKNKNKYQYNGEPVLIGTPLEIPFEGVRVRGLITNIEGVEQPWKEVPLVVDTKIESYQEIFPETTGVQPWIAENIKDGDVIKDSLGEVVVEVLENKIESADKIVTSHSGLVSVVKDPIKKDVYLKLKLKAKEVNGEYYIFDFQRIQVGTAIPLNFKDVNAWTTITKMYPSGD
jgi:hypothetical protein